MQINKECLSVNVDVNMKEVRIIQYALKQLENNTNMDIMIDDMLVRELIQSFTNILNSNWVEEIRNTERKSEDTTIENKPIEIL